MKKYLPLVLLLTSPTLLAEPYMQLGMGLIELDHDEDVLFSDGTALTPDSQESAFQITVGKRYEKFGVEVSYRRFEGDDSKDVSMYSNLPALPSGVVGGTPNEYEEDWDSSLKAQQLALKGIYFHDLNEQITLKGGLGLTYTDYELKSSHTQSWEEDKAGPDWEYDNVISHDKASDTAWGGIVSLGADYVLMPETAPNLTLGVEGSVAIDEYSTVSALLGNVGWKF
ncbi:AcfA family outer membrane beta-barrel protein [Oceanospirillum maris]|uniref:AcfA family outer membrane beta-barrel protein n=1 Tax=Oceanospirillum maris TaxID=64977 RepID=UPI0003F79333|nr:AcfA family outer membrane beta-barrel protein [Oceanospirillum maris]